MFHQWNGVIRQANDWFWVCLFWHMFVISKCMIGNQHKFVAFFANVFLFTIMSWMTFYTFHIAKSFYMIYHVKKTFIAFCCKICDEYIKDKSEIRKHKAEKNVIFLVLVLDLDISNLIQKRQTQSKSSDFRITQFLW